MYLPERLRTPYVFRSIAHNQSGRIQYFPDDMMTEEIYLAAISHNYEIYLSVPKEMRMKEFREKAALVCGNIIKFMKDDELTYDICFNAVSKDDYMDSWDQVSSLKYVPLKFKTKELCIVAYTNKELSKQYIPDELQDDDVIRSMERQYANNTEIMFGLEI